MRAGQRDCGEQHGVRLAHLQSHRGNAASCRATGRNGGQPGPPKAKLPEGRGQGISREQESLGHLNPVPEAGSWQSTPAQHRKRGQAESRQWRRKAISSVRITTNYRECGILMKMLERQEDLNPLWRPKLQIIGLR